MNEKEALNILDQVSAKYLGNRIDHEKIKEALEALYKIIDKNSIEQVEVEPVE